MERTLGGVGSVGSVGGSGRSGASAVLVVTGWRVILDGL